MGVEGMGGVTLRVDPNRLKEQAAEAIRRQRRMKQLFAELETTVSRTRGYWVGEGGERHRQAYFSRKDELQAMLRRLEEHPRELLQMSGNYEAAEAELQAEVSQLRTDVIRF